jgi:hypothetical protein
MEMKTLFKRATIFCGPFRTTIGVTVRFYKKKGIEKGCNGQLEIASKNNFVLGIIFN